MMTPTSPDVLELEKGCARMDDATLLEYYFTAKFAGDRLGTVIYKGELLLRDRDGGQR